MSEDEGEPSEVDEEEVAKEAARVDEARRLRKEKEEKLRKMMDDEDEDEEMADAGVDTPVPDEAEAEGEGGNALDQPKEAERKEEVTVSDGRRRGRRKVTKKQTYQDEDGYLGKSSFLSANRVESCANHQCHAVTKEEASWESFSEDEPEPKKPKMAPVQVKKKTGPAPKGQGNLMNFFKKK
jgi:DNA polymerase delta subunit 3